MKQITSLPRLRQQLKIYDESGDPRGDDILGFELELVTKLNELANDVNLSSAEYHRMFSTVNDQILKYLPLTETHVSVLKVEKVGNWSIKPDQRGLLIEGRSDINIVFTNSSQSSFIKVSFSVLDNLSSETVWFYKLYKDFPYTPVLTENGNPWKPEHIKQLIFRILFAL